MTALDEVGAIFKYPDGPPTTLRTPPWTIFAVEGVLENVLDLTDLSVQRRLNTNPSELTGDWRYPQSCYLKGEGELPPTQLIGKVAYESGRIFAIRYFSAKNTGQGMGFIVFSDRLKLDRPGFLEVYDPNKKIRQRIPKVTPT